MFNTTAFRLQVECGREEFPVTREELQILETLGREMAFSVAIVEDLPDYIPEIGSKVPQQRQLARVTLLEPK